MKGTAPPMQFLPDTERKKTKPLARPMAVPDLPASKGLVRARRSSLWRMLVLPTLLAVVVFFLALLVRDALIRKDYTRRFVTLAQRVLALTDQQGKMPSSSQFGQLLDEVSINPSAVTYEGDRITPDMPADMLLCHAEGVPFFMSENGHVLVFRDGRVRWVQPPEYDQAITKHRQRLTAEALARQQR